MLFEKGNDRLRSQGRELRHEFLLSGYTPGRLPRWGSPHRFMQAFEIQSDRFARHNDGFINGVAIAHATRQGGDSHGIPTLRFFSQKDSLIEDSHVQTLS